MFLLHLALALPTPTLPPSRGRPLGVLRRNTKIKRLSREIGKARKALSLPSSFPSPQKGRKASLQGSSGSRKGSTDGRNPSGANPWRVLRVSFFLPLLGLEVPRDLSRLRPTLRPPSLAQGSWKGWETGSGPLWGPYTPDEPPPGGEPGCTNVRLPGSWICP